MPGKYAKQARTKTNGDKNKLTNYIKKGKNKANKIKE